MCPRRDERWEGKRWWSYFRPQKVELSKQPNQIRRRRSYKVLSAWWITPAHGNVNSLHAFRFAECFQCLNSSVYKLNIVIAYQSHNPQYFDSSYRMTDCLIMWLSSLFSLSRWKEIIIIKFNLFLSNICSGASSSVSEGEKTKAFDSMALGVKNICVIHWISWKMLK